MDVAYRIDGDGPPILLIHGGAEDLTMHSPLAAAIAAHGYRVIWYDRRGTGEATRAAGRAGARRSTPTMRPLCSVRCMRLRPRWSASAPVVSSRWPWRSDTPTWFAR